MYPSKNISRIKYSKFEEIILFFQAPPPAAPSESRPMTGMSIRNGGPAASIPVPPSRSGMIPVPPSRSGGPPAPMPMSRAGGPPRAPSSVRYYR